MTEIKIYKSFLQADKDLDHYCQKNLANELLAEQILDKIPEEVELENLDVCKDINFNYLVGLLSSVEEPYLSVIGLNDLGSYSAVSPAGTSIDVLAKNVKKFLDHAHHNYYGKVGAKMEPVFYTIEKEPGFLSKINRIREAGNLFVGSIEEFEYDGLNVREREEFSRLWEG